MRDYEELVKRLREYNGWALNETLDQAADAIEELMTKKGGYEMNYLKQNNGKFWMTDKNEKVPERCPVCGEEMGLFLVGEPVFLCKGQDQHYFGTLKFPEEQRCVITKN